MYGDVIAANDGERIFTMFAMLAAGVVFAVVVGENFVARDVFI